MLSPTLSVFCEEVQFQEPVCEPKESSPDEVVKHDELSPSHFRNLTSTLLHKTKVNGSSFLSKSFSKMSEEKKRFSRSQSRSKSRSDDDVVQTGGEATVDGSTFPAETPSSKNSQEKKPPSKSLLVKKSAMIPSTSFRFKTLRSKSGVKATSGKSVQEEVSPEITTVQTPKENEEKQVELEKIELPSETTPEETRDVNEEIEDQESQM